MRSRALDPVSFRILKKYLEKRVQRSLRSGFAQLGTNNGLAGYTIVDFGEGELARIIGQYTPDTAFYDPAKDPPTRPNHLPGEISPSYKWSTALQNATRPYEQTQFRQVLSQINWYMDQHETRYGFLLTDCEMVAIKRLDDEGRLELSESVLWSTKGSEDCPQLTVLLALWYLGMLAANIQRWKLMV
ncbi:hypothetical protein BO71DRAFT_395740 [Aspergillus ellipticus CBS 707.79]|uniref:Fungal-type protein kinase domain-containing protein n=1 Tax=Aspergillus ellipticus CBS 707.79 TaxID=1448320 RepID=A0A319DK47_9EURO|nr:hypothetical protein BO71DRAFT_395740 [Aspergillus ellipticus CBS 707.79]